MTPEETLPDDLTFSLSCVECDAGMEVVCYDQALAEGWTEIVSDPGGLTWTYLGLCPGCRRAARERERNRRDV